ncbi:MAG: tetratricopeptide repeat protein [Bacteroidota bacterium]
MKRIIALLVICLVGTYSYAQKKPKITAGLKAMQTGKLDESKAILDQAIVHEKTKDDGKSWYYHGLLYASLDTTTNPQFQNLASDPLSTALTSFEKADELSGGKEYFTTGSNGLPVTKGQQIDMLWGHYLNKGVEQYQAKNNEEAVRILEKTIQIKPQDTTGYIYAGSVALSGKQYDKTKKYYETLVNDLDYHSPDIYNSLIYVASSIDKDDTKALEYIRKAKAQFPQNTEFAKSEINTLIRMDMLEEAQKELETAIENEPGNTNLLFTLGVMYDETDQQDKAKGAYRRALKADPTNYNSQFNLAVIYYNEVVKLLTEKNNLGITAADLKKANEMQKSIDEKLKAALPEWEKANELTPNDQTTLETLKYIYFNLKMYEKAEAVEKQLESLGTGE